MFKKYHKLLFSASTALTLLSGSTFASLEEEASDFSLRPIAGSNITAPHVEHVFDPSQSPFESLNDPLQISSKSQRESFVNFMKYHASNVASLIRRYPIETVCLVCTTLYLLNQAYQLDFDPILSSVLLNTALVTGAFKYASYALNPAKSDPRWSKTSKAMIGLGLVSIAAGAYAADATNNIQNSDLLTDVNDLLEDGHSSCSISNIDRILDCLDAEGDPSSCANSDLNILKPMHYIHHSASHGNVDPVSRLKVQNGTIYISIQPSQGEAVTEIRFPQMSNLVNFTVHEGHPFASPLLYNQPTNQHILVQRVDQLPPNKASCYSLRYKGKTLTELDESAFCIITAPKQNSTPIQVCLNSTHPTERTVKVLEGVSFPSNANYPASVIFLNPEEAGLRTAASSNSSCKGVLSAFNPYCW